MKLHSHNRHFPTHLSHRQKCLALLCVALFPAASIARADPVKTTTAPAAPVASSAPSAPPTPPAPPLLIPPADFPRPARAPIGVNLEQVLDYAHSMMFVDMIKSARCFGSPDAPWDNKAPLDQNGWPTADAGIVVAADTVIPPGDYAFACTGRCDLAVLRSKATVSRQIFDRDKNITTAIVTIQPNADNLFLAFTHTQHGIQNVRLLRPGYPLTTDQVFNKDFLDALAPFSTLRLMDFTRTNESTVQDWNQRPLPTDALQTSSRGCAWEYGIMLANQTHKDLWINIPVRASDDYVKQLAQLLQSKLDKNRVVYVEYSNEVWNTIFPQFHYNYQMAKDEVAAGKSPLNDGGKDANTYYWAWKRVAKRLVEISNIFKTVYAQGPNPLPNAINTTIRPVLASQSAIPTMLRMQLALIAKIDGPPSHLIYGVAGAPYIGPDSKLENRDDATADQLLDSTFDTGMKWIKEATFQYLLLARAYRLHSLCYEGGTGFSGDHSVAAQIAANRDPRIGKLLQDYLAAWYSNGGELFMYFNLASGYGKFGCWGLTEDIRKTTPKTQAIAAVEAAPLPPVVAGISIPGTINATDFNAHEGGGIEKSPAGPGHLAFLHDGNWFDYLLNVSAEGNYNLTLQTASGGDPGAIDVSLSGTSLGTIAGTKTRDGATFADTPPIAVHLQPGQLLLHLHIKKGGLNLLSITLKKQ